MANNPSSQVGLFIPTTNIWDVSQLYSVDVTSPEFKELLVRLYQNVNNIALAVNIKDSGYYNTLEFVNGQLYYPNPALNSSTSTKPAFRQVFRTVVNFGALPNATIKRVPHNIPVNEAYTFTRIYGTASYPADIAASYIPIPFVDAALIDIVELEVDETYVIITTLTDRTAYTTTYVVLEYIKS